MTPHTALAVGSEIPPTDFDGVVAGIFDRACTIRLADGRLATCTTADYFDMPMGIRVNSAAGFRFSSVLTRDRSAHCRGGVLRFGASDLKIDLRGVPVWKADFRPKANPPTELLQSLWRAALAPLCFGFGFPKNEIVALLAGLSVKSKLDPGSFVGGLIGRGPGLTPAGDDLLGGCLAAPMLIAPTRPSSRALRSQIKKQLCATNDISRQMLADATQALFIEPVISVMSAIYGNGQVDRSIRNLRSVGASSGTAMLLGVLAGIAYVENIQLRPTC